MYTFIPGTLLLNDSDFKGVFGFCNRCNSCKISLVLGRFSGSSDIFLRITDKIVENLTGVLKLVDDILVYAESLEQLTKRVRELMIRLRESGLTVSKKKLNISRTVTFAGFKLSPNSIEPDPARIAALTELPAPKNISELRGYNGALNQLSIFIQNGFFKNCCVICIM